MDLYDWYTHPAYDTVPEIKAIQEARQGLTALFIGDYAAAALAPRIEADSTALVENQDVLASCKERLDDVEYLHGTIHDIQGVYDTVVCAYNGLHHRDDVEQAVDKLLDAKATGGVLIILEAAPNSEFIDVLNAINPGPTRPLDPIVDALDQKASVIEHAITSSYEFTGPEHFTDYFAQEFLVHEDKSVVRERIRKHYKHEVGERVAVFVCA